ncbi:3-phosphoserine/phosphohydroxythreonine transaminase [Longirhabdus pacifica]|uniref:3-phosphoserine/phosphohydroxythreonine transaminase n=1 Tax=Longirhabdus pacifica TaxID=2305227 RepID=UPI0010091BF8|nr:3-phosphoserine/phosphohydroxythreonine transaminase [Longirhabdus pacifica]
MGERAYNFNAGPAALPLEVLEKAQQEFVNYKQSGMSIMEVSHRSKEYDEVHEQAQSLLKELLNIPSNYKVLFLQGGASGQFAMLPMNLVKPKQTAAYVLTGSWAKKAYSEAKQVCNSSIIASGETCNWTGIPEFHAVDMPEDTAYIHITSNETIGGIQYKDFPESNGIPLVADMSSDILSRQLDVSKFGVIYAGAQKNLGPSGVTLVIIREDLIEDNEHLPTIYRYATHASSSSLYHTPPVYSIYMVKLVLEWIKEQGGVAAIEKKNKEKAQCLYDVIDHMKDMYHGVASPAYRSNMNVTFRLANEQLESEFIQQSAKQGFIGLKGHRSVGGLRASIYNAVPYENCVALSRFMKEFSR